MLRLFTRSKISFMSLSFSLCLLLSMAIFFPAFSQNNLTIEEALKIAKEQNLKLLQQRKNQERAELDADIQNAQRLPALNLTFNSAYLSKVNVIDISRVVPLIDQKVELGGHDKAELMLSLQQPIFTGFRLKSQAELAENAKLSEAAKLDYVTNEICHKVYILFYQAQNLANQHKILQASLRRLDIQLENVRNLFQADQIMAFDTLQVYNQKLSIKIDSERNLLNQRLVRLQITRLLNLEDKVTLAQLQLQKPDQIEMELKSLMAAAHQNRPELESIRLAKSNAGLQQKLARSAFFPAIYAMGNFHYAKPGLDPVTNEWMDYFSVGVNLQWNLWHWGGDQRQIEKAGVLLNRLSLEEQELLQTVNYQVEESFENLQFSREQLRLAEELQTQQQERYRIVVVQHQNAVATTNDVVTAETDLTRAELQTQSALVEYYIHLADLRRDVGTISENMQ